ncbi:uncharacterized protein LOC129257380 [Lytechinus pictus]|uniref:uncharacterized protein LOC129257380 n=1 Tax=Lytechinus pictus TaxID=7653 RepID=UPI0030B9ED26
MKLVWVLVWILMDYLTQTSVVGQTTMISRYELTFPVCTSSTCDSTGCGNPFGVPVSPCSCDYGCEFFGDCCIDYTYCKQGTPGGSMTSEENKPSVFQDTLRFYDRSQITCVSLPKEKNHYLMVSSCPVDITGNGLDKTKCESDYHEKSNIDFDNLPVSDGLFSYKNVYCALCNGLNLNEITVWELGLLCPESLTAMVSSGNASLSDLLASGECTSSIQPPKDSPPSVVRKCLTSEVISDCPTGSDQNVSVLCQSYQDFVRGENGTTFKNPYCKLCNTFPGITFAECQGQVGDICLAATATTSAPPEAVQPTKPTPRRGNPKPVTPTLSGDRGILNPDSGNALQPLSIVMDFSRNSRVQVVHSADVIKEVEISCQSWEVFDPFVQQCLTLSCPNGYELRDNECHRLTPPLNLTCGSYDSDLMLTVSAKVGLRNPLDITNCNSNELDRNITLYVEHMLNLPLGKLTPLDGSKNGGNDDFNLMSEDKCLSLFNNSFRMDYEIEETSLTFAQLEELTDKTLLQHAPYNDASEYHVWSLTISQQCISILGLSECPGGLKLLTNPNVSHVQNYTVVQDENTGMIYHSYETVFAASYQSSSSVSSINYNKSLNIQVCDQMKLRTCSRITQPASIFSPLDDLSLNNTLTGQILGFDDYVLTSNGSVQYCAPENFGRNATLNQTTEVRIFDYDEAQVILSFVGVSISLFSLMITFATYCIFPHMRRCVSNKLIMVLCVILFLAQLLQMISGLWTSVPELCTSLSAVSHFLWISVFAITTCLAFELNRTLASRDSFTVSTNSTRAIVSYLLFTVLTASIIVGCCLAIHFTVGEDLNFSYGNDNVCWIVNHAANLIAFGCPLGVFLIINTILFLHTVAGIRNASKVRRSMVVESESIKHSAKDLRVYLKISTLLGFTWSFGFIAGFANISALWYIFIILNSLQGFYIFLAFIANGRVYSMWATCLCHCNTSLHRYSRGSSSIPFSQRMSRMTSVSSLPRTSEYNSNKDSRIYSGEKGASNQRYSTANQKLKNDRMSSGGDQSETKSDRGSPSGIRRYSHGEWKYAGERKQSGDRKYQTASDWRNVSAGKSLKQ